MEAVAASSRRGVYIDPIAVALMTATGRAWIKPINLFADDIVLISPAAAEMQRLQDVRSTWAAANWLTWGVDKCHALSAPGCEQSELLSSLEPLTYVQHAEYLCVNICASGVTAAAIIERLAKTEALLHQLRATGLNRPRSPGLDV